jgi:hypothetical protein
MLQLIDNAFARAARTIGSLRWPGNKKMLPVGNIAEIKLLRSRLGPSGGPSVAIGSRG